MELAKFTIGYCLKEFFIAFFNNFFLLFSIMLSHLVLIQLWWTFNNLHPFQYTRLLLQILPLIVLGWKMFLRFYYYILFDFNIFVSVYWFLSWDNWFHCLVSSFLLDEIHLFGLFKQEFIEILILHLFNALHCIHHLNVCPFFLNKLLHFLPCLSSLKLSLYQQKSSFLSFIKRSSIGIDWPSCIKVRKVMWIFLPLRCDKLTYSDLIH